MIKLLSSVALALFLCVPALSFAKPAPLLQEVKISMQEGRESEITRRGLLDQHIAWQWAVAVKVNRREEDPIDGMMVGMQGDMVPEVFTPSGNVKTIAWLDSAGTVQWAGSVLVAKDGSVVYRFREGEGAWAEDPDQEKFNAALSRIFGRPLHYDLLLNWATGVPGDGMWPRHYVSGPGGTHPTHSRVRRGKIEWSGWQVVETEKGEKMSMPGAWEVSLGSRKIEFVLGGFEGYAADELPNPSWPYVAKGQSGFVLGKEEDPIVPDDELDYKEW